MTTGLSVFGIPRTAAAAIGAKATGGLALYGTRIAEFDIWRAGYAGANVQVIVAGTTTLAALFADSGLTQPVANPVTLLSLSDDNGNSYGKFQTPIYVYQPYTLFVQQGNQTGIERPPLYALDDADASFANVTSARGGYPVSLQGYVDREVDATLFGPLSLAIGSAQCTETLVAAIGAASAAGGGEVLLPGIEIPITTLALPEGVVLAGRGKGATTLVSTQAVTPSITLGGDGAGLRNLTLDGINLLPQSVGLLGIGIAQPILENVVIRRFDTGLIFRGAINALWRDLTVTNCHSGADLRGDLDSSGAGAGSETANVRWEGGELSLNTVYGLRFYFENAAVRDCIFQNVLFASNSGYGIGIAGGRGIRFLDCQWSGNSGNLSVVDGLNTAYAALNTTERIRFTGGRINGGTLIFNQTCLDIQFEDMELVNVNGQLSIPSNPIVFKDCIEDAQTTFTGDLTKLVQRNATDTRGTFSGVTTDATPTAAWERVIPAGGVILASARAVARRRDGITYGNFWEVAGAARPFATMTVQSATGTFTVGLVLTGATSGASARIGANTQTGANASLSLRDITGTFIVGEIVHDSSAGSGRYQGSIAYSNLALDGSGTAPLRTAATTGSSWAIAFAVSGSMLELLVTGEAGAVVEWEVEIEALEP